MSRALLLSAAVLTVLVLGSLTGCPKPAPSGDSITTPPATNPLPMTQEPPADEPEAASEAKPAEETAEAPAEGGGEIAWLTDYDEATKAAADEGKRLLIDIYSTTCGPCRQLDEETWPDPKIIELSGKFVCLKVNSDENPDVTAKFKTEYVPQLIIADAEGNVLLEDVGFKGADDMAKFMEEGLAK